MAFLLKGGFNLLGNKRAGEDSAVESRPPKLPKASNISVEKGPRPVLAPRRLPMTAPVDVCIYRVTELASDLWDLLHGRDNALFQVQIRHEAQRAITFDVRNSFNDFLRAAHRHDPRIPNNLSGLERACGVRLIVTDRADPDDVGFVQWRTAFYCVDLQNFLLLLDGFFQYKEKQTTQPFQVVIHPHVGIDVSLADLQYKHYALQEPKELLPLHIFEAQPVVRKVITWLNIEVESEDTISIVITGYTWPYRQRLDNMGIAGGYFSEDEENKENRKYYRVWNNIDVSDDKETDKFMKMLGDDAFKKLCMRVTLDAQPVLESATQKFIEKLKEQPFLFFSSQPRITSAAPNQKPMKQKGIEKENADDVEEDLEDDLPEP